LTGVRLQLLALTMALLGGPAGALGAIAQEMQSGAGILLAFVGAPIIEEALKPAGIYLLLIRWPHALRGRLHIAMLTGLSGLCFGVIEAFVYVTLYVPDHSDDFVIYRFTLPLVVHTLGSFIVGLGLSRAIIDWAAGRGPMPKSTRNFYLAAVCLHAAFNITAIALSLAGVLDFDES
jgi:RsiW-degrading membrane proteinase PrsW (M82 family)